MDFQQILTNSPLVLTEGAISERIRRREGIELHSTLFNTPLIYETKGATILEEIYFSYREVASDANLPILLSAPTWRVDKERVTEAGVKTSINCDAVTFMKNLQAKWQTQNSPVLAGALLAPKNDCYKPDLALSTEQAKHYHAWQIDKLTSADPEVIIAQTIPAISEALGIAHLLGQTAASYIISFVIDENAKVLDGTPVAVAIDTLDQQLGNPPVGYMVNCVYPTFLKASEQAPEFFTRLVGIQANASSKGLEVLDGSDELQQDPISIWGDDMLDLHKNYGVKILGGCCGTTHRHMRYLTENI